MLSSLCGDIAMPLSCGKQQLCHYLVHTKIVDSMNCDRRIAMVRAFSVELMQSVSSDEKLQWD
jgi:hypothetical protein